MLSRCTSCHGRKRIVGLGNIEKECPVCKGIGWVTLDVVVAASDEPILDSKIRNKRASRKTDNLHA